MRSKAHHIQAYTPELHAQVLALSLRAWAPVFEKMKPAVQDYVYEAFYPDGWRARQTADVSAILEAEGVRIWVAVEDGSVLGWVGIRLHPEDFMGEIHILAVDPPHQGRGVATALMGHAMAEMREAGMRMVMVETGGDPGHAPSRATYESAGFERWPVARYFRKL
jgi:GNAT superfamily N-acetyltransferase